MITQVGGRTQCVGLPCFAVMYECVAKIRDCLDEERPQLCCIQLFVREIPAMFATMSPSLSFMALLSTPGTCTETAAGSEAELSNVIVFLMASRSPCELD